MIQSSCLGFNAEGLLASGLKWLSPGTHLCARGRKVRIGTELALAGQ